MNTNYLRSMETAVTFIEEHLQEDISVGNIAAAVSYSLFHFCRIFNQIVHHPPYDYLIRRRLSAAAIQLQDGNQRITDLAFSYQFGSPESFSRAFRRMFGEIPKNCRQQGLRDPRQLMNPLSPAHLSHRNQPGFQRPTLVNKEGFTAVGLMTIAKDDAAVAQLMKQNPSANCFIIRHYPDYWSDQGRPVLVGTLNEPAGPPLVSQTIPAYQYACFGITEVVEERPLLSDYIYQTWLPQSDYKLAAPFELEQDHNLFVPVVLEK